MDAAELRERITKGFLREIESVEYPSTTMLNRVERDLKTRAELAAYTDVLVRKVEATNYPSTALLDRLDSLFERLERAERAEQAERAAAD